MSKDKDKTKQSDKEHQAAHLTNLGHYLIAVGQDRKAGQALDLKVLESRLRLHLPEVGLGDLLAKEG